MKTPKQLKEEAYAQYLDSITTFKIYSIKDLNDRIKKAGFRTARIFTRAELEDGEEEKLLLKTALEPNPNLKKEERSFIKEVLEPILKLKIIEVKWYKTDCVKVYYESDNSVETVDMDDDV